MERKARRGDVIVCWGESLGNIDGVRILNGTAITNKYNDALRLREQRVPTIEVSQTMPRPTPPSAAALAGAPDTWEEVVEAARDFIELPFSRERIYQDGVGQLSDLLIQLRAQLAAPPPAPQVQGEWLPRLYNHVGGNDLLNRPGTPQYFSKKETLVREYRVHSFDGRSIRAGVKAPREGFTEAGAPVARDVHPAGRLQLHPWVRSWDGGWRILYDGVTARQAQRDIAHAAVRALGLTFGAVDIGEKADGSLIVLEVNRAPGLDGGTIDNYARAIQQWIGGAGNAQRQAA
jgi:hypothetical protein